MGGTHTIKRQSARPARRGRDHEPHGGYHHKVRRAKQRIVLSALLNAHGSFADAAKALKVNRTYLHRLVRDLGLRDLAAQLFSPGAGALADGPS